MRLTGSCPRNKEQNLFEFSSYPQANHKLQKPTAHQSLIAFLPFSVRDQKQVVGLPSLYSPGRSEGDGWCWTNLQNTHFSGLKRKRRDFERSVLKYVSIKIPALTHSGRKRRVCINAADRLLPPEQRTNSFAFLQISPTQPQVAKTNSPSAAHSFSAFQRSPSKAGRGVAFLILARAQRGRWLVLDEFAKYAFFWPDKKKSSF